MAESVGANVEKLANSLEELSKKAYDSQNATQAFINSISAGGGVVTSFTEAFTGLSEKALKAIPLVGENLSNALGTSKQAFEKLIGLTPALLETYQSAIQSLDGVSAGQRKLTSDLFNSQAAFGVTNSDVAQFTKTLTAMNAEFQDIDYGYLAPEELKKSVETLASSGIGFAEATKELEGFANGMNLAAMGILHAGAIGLDSAEYFKLLSDAIKGQGLTSEEAVSQMTAFSDTAKETGLGIGTVSSTLNQAASSMSKFGMTAAAGRPILEGFARSLSETGLGIRGATDLTSTLIGSFKSLTENYSMAYVTMQRGGLDFGAGGGVLGGSIGLRAKMLEAEKSPEAQADLGREMIKGMRDTIASFTGGEIITVQEAARSPGLQTQFYAQEQLLSSMYGIKGAEADRTLDLMKNLEKMMTSGEGGAATEEMLKEFVDMRAGTKDMSEILDIKFSNFLAGLAKENKTLIDSFRESSLTLVNTADAALKKDPEALEKLKEGLKKAAEEAGVDPGKVVETVGKTVDTAKDAAIGTWNFISSNVQTVTTGYQQIQKDLQQILTSLSTAASYATTISSAYQRMSGIIPGTQPASP